MTNKLQFNSFVFLLLACLLIISYSVSSQCFSSPGNPIGGNANLGNVEKNLLRFGVFYKYSVSDKYFKGDKLYDYKKYEKADFNYVGNVIAYGLTKKLTLEAESGYFINKTVYPPDDYSKKGYGFSNAIVSMKYGIYNNFEKRIRYTASLGAKIPFSQEMQTKDEVVLPIDVQPSTGSYGLILQSYLLKENSLKATRYFMINRYEINFENKDKYKYGNVLFTSLFFSKHLHFRQQWISENWTAILQLRNEYRSRDYYADRGFNGSVLFYISPQLNYSIKEKFNISVLTDIPVYQYYNDVQLANKFSLLVNMTMDLVFKK
jgi:hypothetical protein